jgi:hypothetical protein
MRKLRGRARHDICHWLDTILRAAAAQAVRLPGRRDYLPVAAT